jgi:hypothetical protein
MNSIELKIKEIFEIVLQKEKEASKFISECDLEEQDILHYFEFAKFSAYKAFSCAMELKKIRERRRCFKDELIKIFEVKRRLQGVKSIMGNPPPKRIYTPRIRMDLKISQNSKISDIQKLQKVNKTNLKFRYSEEDEKLSELFKKIEK